MKKQNINTPFHANVKRFFLSIGLAGFLLVGLAADASAQTSKKPSADINYIGSLDGQPVFKVDLDNKEGSTYNLRIKDGYGATLYSQKITGKQFSKKFRFDRQGEENLKLVFILSGDKEEEAQEFRVNTLTEILNNVVVTKL